MADLDGPRWGPQVPPVRQLVVLCHGVGADGHDLIDLAPTWAKALPHAAFVAPNAPQRYDMAPEMGGMAGRQWFSITDRTPAVLAAGVARAAEALNRFVDAELDCLALPPDAYALMGFSQGAMTALYTGLRRAVPPRLILAFSGALLAADRLGEARAGQTQGWPPVLLVHGEADEVVPAAASRLAESALRTAGVEVEAVFRPGLGHGIDDVGVSTGALALQKAFADHAG
jgi:phospholipase/carboxylesterase